MKKRYIFALLIFMFGIALFFTPFNLAHVCFAKSDGTFMRCYWMGEVVRMLGGLVAILGVLFALSEKVAKGIAVSIVGLAGCELLLQFYVIGPCKTHTMPCNTYTKPTVIFLAVVLMVVSLFYIFLTRKEN